MKQGLPLPPCDRHALVHHLGVLARERHARVALNPEQWQWGRLKS